MSDAGAFMKTDELDCQRCGACCCNRQENMNEAFRDYVEIDRSEPLFQRKDLMKKLAIRNGDGEFHLRLVGDEQRCIALLGKLGARVECDIYSLRPAGCRRVEPGGEACLLARRERGLEGPKTAGAGMPVRRERR